MIQEESEEEEEDMPVIVSSKSVRRCPEGFFKNFYDVTDILVMLFPQRRDISLYDHRVSMEGEQSVMRKSMTDCFFESIDGFQIGAG